MKYSSHLKTQPGGEKARHLIESRVVWPQEEGKYAGYTCPEGMTHNGQPLQSSEGVFCSLEIKRNYYKTKSVDQTEHD